MSACFISKDWLGIPLVDHLYVRNCQKHLRSTDLTSLESKFHTVRLAVGGSASIGSFREDRVCVCPLKLWHKSLVWFHPDNKVVKVPHC